MKYKKYSRVDGVRVVTKEYATWNAMLKRCATDGKTQVRQPTYIGCSVSEMFKDFQLFAEWCNNQVGFGLKGYALDKDILVCGNKVYSEAVCVFVPQALNNFLTLRTTERGEYPLGVYCDEPTGKYVSRISIDGKRKHLGRFLTPTSAHTAYVTAKESEARRWHKRLLEEFVVDPRVIERMTTWKVVTDTEMF